MIFTIGNFTNIGKNAKLDLSSLAYLAILVKKPNLIFIFGIFDNIGKKAKHYSDWQYFQYW